MKITSTLIHSLKSQIICQYVFVTFGHYLYLVLSGYLCNGYSNLLRNCNLGCLYFLFSH